MRRPLIALALVLAGLLVPARASSVTMSEWSTRYWAQAYGIDPDWLWSVALCESSGSPWAVGPDSADGRPYGLFQVKPATWQWLVRLENLDPTLAPHLTRFDPESRAPDADDGAAEAHIAAWASYRGMTALWECMSK